ncbi:hypothetical protein EYR38_003199 [Pleurotus pulmonarius]|nr:hypothetical protein EYR38_003199 [Pleurotus pulmonarius]
MKLTHKLLPRPPRQDPGGSPPETRRNSNNTRNSLANAQDAIVINNYNEGPGVFNYINGNQDNHTHTTIILYPHPNIANTSFTIDTASIDEPYRSAVGALAAIISGLNRLHETPSVLNLREEIQRFIPVVVCVARVMETIRRISPRFADHTIFSESDRQCCNPNSRRIIGDKDGELTRLVTSAGLPPSLDIRDLEVPTIFIQAATGSDVYAVPLNLCTSLQDIALIISQYCQDRPESHYIYSGAWELVCVDDNKLIKGTGTMKPGAFFDIGIVVEQLIKPQADDLMEFIGGNCPQCGQHHEDTHDTTWVRCSNVACGRLFREGVVGHVTMGETGHIPWPESSSLQVRVLQQDSQNQNKFRRVLVTTHFDLVAEPL